MNFRETFAPPFASSSSYRPDIDGLRAVAVLAVVGFHFFPGRVPGGFVGVDVFFVISGCLITGILLRSLQEGTFSLAGFYSRRIRRIFPALAVVLAASFALGWALLIPSEFRQLGQQIVAGALFVANFLFWNESGYFFNPETKPLLHLWSLSIEEQFYIVWPVLLWFATSRKWPLLSTIAAITLLSFATNVIVTNNNPVAGFFSPITRAWELGLGALLAYWHNSMKGRSWDLGGRGLSLVGLAMIVGTVFLLDKTATFPGWWAAIPVVGTCLVIAAGSDSFVNRRFLSLQAVVWIGLISYPLYLWHWVLLTFGFAAVEGALAAVPRIGLILLSVLLADLTYRFVERPIRFGGVRPVKIAALVGSLAIIAVVGGQAWRTNGFPARYDATLMAGFEELRDMPDKKARRRAAKAKKRLLTRRYNQAANDLWGKCWVGVEKPADWLATHDCLPKASSKPRVLIWGDSHAAAFYTGASLDENLNVGLVARAICIGTLTKNRPGPSGHPGDGNRPPCLESNKQLLSEVGKNPPEIVVLFGAWYHEHYYADPKNLLEGVNDFAKELRERGVGRVIVAGPTPHWSSDLPKIIYKRWKKLVPPLRLNEELEPNAFELDRLMRKKSWHPGVEYFSMIDVLCNDDGCLTHAPGSRELTSFNYGHLTPPAGEYVIKKMVGGSEGSLSLLETFGREVR